MLWVGMTFPRILTSTVAFSQVEAFLTIDNNFEFLYLLNASETLCPPKPNELFNAYSMGRSCGFICDKILNRTLHLD